ncbi:MAG: pyridoxal phosphate-dependent aminotransferase [Verrucomicrobia bacterium]|nr:pyridoxal phosphate-dependent aminotransferase [Verrucomicrobiota bacterium]
MNKKIWLSLAHMGGHEQNFIKEAFDTNWVVPLGPNVNAFEAALSEYLGENRHAVALSAGTAALHLGLIQLGVGAGDEVICQSFTFAASANPVVYCGGVPVFVDSEEETWNMDPVLLEKAILDRKEKTGKVPKAIIPVHLYGMPAKMDEICAVAEKYGVPVLEDAAEALGAEYKGRKCGTFGDFAALSFNGNKIITTSGGGALICRTQEQAKRTMFYATQARENRPYYQHEKIGYNYRMSNICAGIGRGQMEVLDAHVARRREIHALYTKLLAGTPGITVKQAPGAEFASNFWLTCILVDPEKFGTDYEALRQKLDAANIETRPLWKPMHLQPVYASAPFYGNGTSEKIFSQGLCLPSGSSLSDDDIARVVSTIKA